VADRRVVHRVEDGEDRQQIEATTYQMRNPFKQLRDGFFTHLDVMNYLHHHWIAKQARRSEWVLDVCCGRGIMLPLLRYHAPDIGAYVGVDIKPANAEWLTKRVTDGTFLNSLPAPREARPAGMPDSEEPFTYTRETYYPFPTYFVHSNVSAMAPLVQEVADDKFDLIIYTQSIEHMHPDAGYASLEQCALLANDVCRMIISGPNTPQGVSGYDTRYRAHVYEWSRQELHAALRATGWDIKMEWGLTLGKAKLAECMARAGLAQEWGHLSTTVPTEWLSPVLASLFPEESDEIAILATRSSPQTQLPGV